MKQREKKESVTSWVRCFSDPPLALSDKKICTPPTKASTAPIPANLAKESVYVEVGDAEGTYDKLHPYSNEDAERQQYSQFSPRRLDVATPVADSAEEGVNETWNAENTYHKLHPYSNEDADRQQYSQFAPRGRDVNTPTADSEYVNIELPMGKKESKVCITMSRKRLTPIIY